MLKKFVWGVLFFIVLLALFVRFFNLTSVPPSPYLDEVSNGYNAYSLLKTGNDEYGKHLPLLMQAYNDGRPTMFVYLTIPFIQLFGLTLFALRLPVVILSVLATVSIFFLTRELLGSHEKKREQLATLTGLFAALFYAVSPWSIYSSRIADETTMSVSFFIFGLTLLLYALNRTLRKVPFLLAIVCLVISFYSYHAIKFFLPVFAIGVVVIFWKDFLARWKVVLTGLFLGLVLLVPLLFAFSQPGAMQRLGGVNKEDPNIIARSSKIVLLDKTNHDRIGQVFDNRRVALSLEFANNYLRNFAPAWLFLQQGNNTFRVPDFGPMYHFGLLLVLLGIILLIRDNAFRPRYKAVLVLWILASVIPAALSSESPHLNHANALFPGLIILQAMGVYVLLNWISNFHSKYVKYGSYALTGAVIFVSFVWFWHAYFSLFPYQESKRYQYGVTDAFLYAKQVDSNYQKVIVSNGDNLLMSYMYFLYATKYDPATYQKQGGTHSAFFTDTHLIGKYDFRNPNLYEPTIEEKDNLQQMRVLYITNPSELSDVIVKNENIRMIKKFQFIDGTDSVWVLEGTIQKKK